MQKRRIETHALVNQTGSNVTFHEPRVHAFVYEPTTGILNKLDVNFNEYIRDLRSVYDLYRLEPEAGATEIDKVDIVKSILDS